MMHMKREVLGIHLSRSIGGWYCRIDGQPYRFERTDSGSWNTFQLPGKPQTNTILLRSTRTIIDAVKIIQAEAQS
jgi:hypothetical protein